jgi:hypothetical protein
MASAELGSAPNQAHLADWVADPDVDDDLKELVEELRRELSWEGSPAELADELGEFYAALIDSDEP